MAVSAKATTIVVVHASAGGDGASSGADDTIRLWDVATGSTVRIDDPVRLYLTQMGEIPLLTREDELRLVGRGVDRDEDVPGMLVDG